MDFADGGSFNKALELDGSELEGCALQVEEAKPRTDSRDGFSGGRSGGRGFGGRDGGRGSRGRGGGGRGFSGGRAGRDGGRSGGGRFSGGRGRGGSSRPSMGTAATGTLASYLFLA